MTVEAVLQVQDLTVQLSTSAKSIGFVDHVSFDLHAGEVLALMGESGAGKTMTALSILRLLRWPLSVVGGRIVYRGADILTMSPRELRAIRGRGVAAIFQNPIDRLDPLKTIGSQLREVIALHRLARTRSGARSKALELLTEVRIADPSGTYERYPHELSGGMAQRVGIALAIAASPEILIADEPTSALDVTIESDILDLLRRLLRQHKLSLLVITHDVRVARQLADTVAVMYAGQIVEYGDATSVLSRPEHPYTEALLACVPSGATTRVKPIPGAVPDFRHLPPGCRFAPRCPHATPEFEANPPALFRGDRNAVRCWLKAP